RRRGLVDDQHDARRREKVAHQGKTRGVLRAVVEKRLFRRRQVAQVGFHGCNVRLLLRVGELRDGDRRQEPDDHHHDEQFEQRKAASRHHLRTLRARRGAERFTTTRCPRIVPRRPFLQEPCLSLGIDPIHSNADSYDEWHPQVGGALHMAFYQLRGDWHLTGRHLKYKLIMYL